MKSVVFLILLPCILAKDIERGFCKDGTQCPEGKYCCESGCCDFPTDLEGKKYVPGLIASSPTNLSMAESEAMHAPCPGTQCGLYCYPKYRYGVCCYGVQYACPSGSHCCTNSYSSETWCCKRRQICYTTGYCLNGATAISTSMTSMLFVFMMGIFMKYSL